MSGDHGGSGSGGGRQAERLTRERRPDLWRRYSAAQARPAHESRQRGGAMNILQQLEAEQVAKAGRRPAGAAVSAGRHGAGQRRGRRRRARAHPGLRGRLHRPQERRASTRTSRCARSPTAKGSSASSRCYSPRITAIEVVRRGVVRRAKLYYLRGRTGKAARIAERAATTAAANARRPKRAPGERATSRPKPAADAAARARPNASDSE